MPLEVEGGVVEALSAEAAQVPLHLAVALEVPVEYALQTEGLERTGRAMQGRTCAAVPVVNWGKEGREVQCGVGGRERRLNLLAWAALTPLKIPNRCRLWAARWNRAAPPTSMLLFEAAPRPQQVGVAPPA